MLEIISYMYNNIQPFGRCAITLQMKKMVTYHIITIKDLPSWFMWGNETGAIKETVSILPLLIQIMKTVLIGLVGNHVFLSSNRSDQIR